MFELTTPELFNEIKNILEEARANTYKSVNIHIIDAYLQIGKIIVAAQEGNKTAEYGSGLLIELSKKLQNEYGKGFDQSNLRRMRQFFLQFENRDTLCHELSWSHYRVLMKVENGDARTFYINECTKSRWSVRELGRQVNTFYYERLLSSQDKKAVEEHMKNHSEELTTKDIIKDLYVLEF